MKTRPPFFTYFILNFVALTIASQTGFSTTSSDVILSFRMLASINDLTTPLDTKTSILVKSENQSSALPNTSSLVPETFPDQSLTVRMLKEHGIKFRFYDNNLVGLTGILPTPCANSLFVSMKSSLASSSDEGSEGASDEDFTAKYNEEASKLTIADLKEKTTIIGVAPFFHTGGSYKTLNDCVISEKNKPDSSNTDLATSDHLTKNLMGNSVLGKIVFMNEKNQFSRDEKALATTSSYKTAEQILRKLDCAHCLRMSSTFDFALNSQKILEGFGLHVNLDTLLLKAIFDGKAKLDDANSLTQLVHIRADLLRLRKNILLKRKEKNFDGDSDQEDCDSDQGQIIQEYADAFLAIEKRAEKIARQDPKNASNYADFILKTAKSVSKLKPRNSDFEPFRLAQLETSKNYSQGNDERLTFLSSIDPQNAEIASYLSNGTNLVSAAVADANKKCSPFNSAPANQALNPECLSAMQNINTMNAKLLPLQLKFYGISNLPVSTDSTSANSTLVPSAASASTAQNAASIPQGYFLNGSPKQFQTITSVFGTNVSQNLVPTPQAGGYIPTGQLPNPLLGYVPPNS